MKMQCTLHRATTGKLWELVAVAIAELAQRKDDPTTSPRVEIRRINGGQPEATITVIFKPAEPGGCCDGTDIPALACIGNATLSKTNLHHFEAIPVSKKLVATVNRRAYHESSRGVL